MRFTNSGLKTDERVALEVRGHDQHGVREVHSTSLAVCEAPVVEHLQQDVEHVRVGLLDLVEEDDGVGAPAHGLGQLAPLLVADIARWGSHEARDAVFSWYSPMSMRIMARSSSKRTSARALASSVLPTPVGPRNRNDPMGRLGRETGAAAPDGVGDRLHGVVLADHTLVQADPRDR